MANVTVMGECMMELLLSKGSTIHYSFAGDFYNTAVYLKRCFPQHKTSVFTAVGQDTISDSMLKQFQSEDLKTDLCLKHSSRHPGIYMVETDNTGERSFLYWRDNSAAKSLIDLLLPTTTQLLKATDTFYFTGISLAILKEDTRDDFWTLLKTLKKAGVTIAFDPNYRAKLWKSTEDAKTQFEKAFALSDIQLPGLEDLSQLYGLNKFSDAHSFFSDFGFEELIIKNGPQGVYAAHQGECEFIELKPVKNVVDTTSAGDAFNGVFLGAQLSGEGLVGSIEKAAQVAAFVIQHKGAIVNTQQFSRFQLRSNARLIPS